MRSKYFQIISFLLLTTSVILASCGGGGGGGDVPAASLAMKGTSGNAVNMNGTWVGGCTYTGQENERDTLTLNGGSATVNMSIWSAPTTNGNCTQTGTPDVSATLSVTATLASDPTQTAIWINGNGVVSPAPTNIPATAKATKATLVFNAATVTFGSDFYVVGANSSGFCGRTNWVKNVPQNVLNCTDVVQSTTETDYWVVDDSAPQLKWYSGDTGVAWQVYNIGPMVK